MCKHNSSISNSDELNIETKEVPGRKKHDIAGFWAALCVFIGLFILFIKLVLPQYDQGYDASLIDKVNRLKSIEGPKMVLIGNSNLAFGMDSEMLEAAVGMPVVNMGLHGGAGNSFHENMAKLNITEGDIYVFCYHTFEDGGSIAADHADTMVVWTAIEDHFGLWKLVNPSDIPYMLKGFPTYLRRSLYRFATNTGNENDPVLYEADNVYARFLVNQYGDACAPRTTSEYTFTMPVNPPRIADNTINRINELNDYITSRGATMLVAGIPIGNGELTADVSEFEAFTQEISNRLTCTVISNYADYLYDYSYFYDTNGHLTDDGTKLRTKQLITDLYNWSLQTNDPRIAVPASFINTGILQ